MTVEVIEGEARELEPERAIVPVSALPQTQVIMGAAALALMSPEEFDRNLLALEVARERADRIKKALMKEGTDYGTVPGVTKAFLWKSGAETLDGAFGLVPTFDVVRITGDGITEPPYSFHAHSLIHLGSKDGPIVGEGFGTCNPWESRYRYRNGERLCPNCGKPAVIKGKAEYGGGWLCWAKKDGCGSKWPDGDQAIEGQNVGQVENPDPYDLENTCAKMAEKRAHIDGSIRATRTSGLFTQDDDSPAVKREAERAAVREAPALETGEGGSIIGTAEATRKAMSNWMLKAPAADGLHTLGFRLRSGTSAILVEARGSLAEALDAFRKDVEGERVTVWGTVTDRSFEEKGTTVTFQVLAATRIRVPELGDLPQSTEAESVAMFSDKPDIDEIDW